jgi:hypothetical protein
MVDDDWSYLVEWFWEGYGFKGRGKLGIRHEREGTIQMPWKKLRVHHEREEHYSDAVQKTQSPSRTGRALFRCRAENSESITNGKGTIQMPCRKLRVHHEREGHYSDAVQKTQSPSRTGRARVPLVPYAFKMNQRFSA